jgi:peroxiredoxin
MIWHKNRTTFLLVAIIILMGAEIVYLVYQNRQLRQMVDDPARFFEKTLRAGQTVPAIRAEDINGKEVGLTYSPDSPFTLVLWFSPTCSSCEDNFGFWQDVYRLSKPEKLRIVGFCACTVGEGKEVTVARQLNFSVLAATEPTIVDLYKGNLLPQTILIAPDGQIMNVWPGALLESQKKEILSILGSLHTIKPEGGE